MPELIDAIRALTGAATLETREDGGWIELADLDVVEMASRLGEAEALLSTITAVECTDGETDLIYHYRRGTAALNIKTRTRGNCIVSITPVCPAANWIEREIHDLYAVEFAGHPNPERLIRPPELPAGFFRQGQTPRPADPQR